MFQLIARAEKAAEARNAPKTPLSKHEEEVNKFIDYLKTQLMEIPKPVWNLFTVNAIQLINNFTVAGQVQDSSHIQQPTPAVQYSQAQATGIGMPRSSGSMLNLPQSPFPLIPTPSPGDFSVNQQNISGFSSLFGGGPSPSPITGGSTVATSATTSTAMSSSRNPNDDEIDVFINRTNSY
jgi:hypothetical protein